MAPHFDQLLQKVIDVCISNQEKHPEVREFVNRTRLRAKDFKLLNYKITIPAETAVWEKDMSLENQLFSLVSDRKWSLVADMFLQIPLKEYQDMTKFAMKLFEVVTETEKFLERNVKEAEICITPGEAFVQFLSEIRKKRAMVDFLPVQKEIFAQLAASFVLHLSENPEEALPIILECYKGSQLEPCLYHSFYSPEAYSGAVRSRQEPMKVGTLFLTIYYYLIGQVGFRN